MAVELLESTGELPRYPTDYPSPHWLRFSNQGQFHPLKYLIGLTRVMTETLKNCQIYTNTHVLEVQDDNKEDGTGEVYAVTSDLKRVDCKKMVLAT